MRKADYTVQEICRGSSIMQKSEMASISSLVYECPSCHQHTFSFDDDYRIGYCSNCGVFIDAYTKRGDVTASSDCDYIFAESMKHTEEKMLKKEKESYLFSDRLFKNYHVGYLPHRYWSKKEEDTRFGKLTFPMCDFCGNIINICGKDVGKEEKLTGRNSKFFIYPYRGGFFNCRAIWNEEVNLFENPIDCLSALSADVKNSVFSNDRLSFPGIITFSKLIIFCNNAENGIVSKAQDLLKDTSVSIEVVTPDKLGTEYIYQYFLAQKKKGN